VRKTRRRDARELRPLVGEDARYCALCETVMLFESVGPAGLDAESPGEWVCVSCGSAVFVDPPVQVASERIA
jgi:hypothetical protein